MAKDEAEKAAADERTRSERIVAARPMDAGGSVVAFTRQALAIAAKALSGVLGEGLVLTRQRQELSLGLIVLRRGGEPQQALCLTTIELNSLPDEVEHAVARRIERRPAIPPVRRRYRPKPLIDAAHIRDLFGT